MIGWLKRLFRRPSQVDPRAEEVRHLLASLPPELVRGLAEDLADAELAKGLQAGYALEPGERDKVVREIEFRLLNPGKHTDRIPVRAQALYTAFVDRSKKYYPSSSSSPIG